MNEPAEIFGRGPELEALAALVARAAGGEPTTVFIDGAAGIGKTRLLDEVAARVGIAGGLVLRGAAPPMSGEPMPFAAIGRLLKDALRQLPPDERDAAVERSPGLGHLLPGWRLSAATSPPPTSAVAMSEELVDAIESLARDRAVLALLLDDLQWADPATLDLVAYLARASLDARLLLVVAARLEEVPGDAPIHRVRAELLRIGGRPMSLAPLGDDDAAAYLASLVGSHASPRRSADIAALGAGNPLFLAELAGSAEGAAGGAVGLPESLRALTRARLSRLSPVEAGVMQVVATIGEACPEELVVHVVGQAEDAAIGAIEALTEGRMLSRVGDGSVQVATPILREVVLADAVATQLRRIRAAAAKAIAADPQLLPGSEAERSIRLANLWDGAGDRMRALPALVRAADAAEGTFAFATAFDLYARALRLVERETPQPDRSIGFEHRPDGPTVDDSLGDLRARAADAAILAGDPPKALEWLDVALLDVRDPAVRARLQLVRARALLAMGDGRAAADLYRAVQESGAAPERSGSAKVGLARSLLSIGEAPEAVAAATDALETARSTRSRPDEETALLVLGTALVRAGNLVEGAQRLHEAGTMREERASLSTIRPRVSRVMDLTGGLTDAAAAAETAGLVTEARDWVTDAEGAARRWGAAGESARLAVLSATGAIHDGRWDDALRGLDEAVNHPATMLAALARRARIAALRGAWDRAADDLARCEAATVRARPEDRVAFAIAQTEVLGGRRQNDAAAAAATEGLAMARDAPPVDRMELVALAVRSHVDAALAARAVRSAAESSDHEEVARALATEAAREKRPEVRAISLSATVEAELGRLAVASTDAWAVARAAWEREGSVWWIAYVSTREGESLLAASGRKDAAREALLRARSIATSLEASPLVAEIDALATRGRLDLAARIVEPSERGADRRLPISDREMEVLVLIAKGLTNKEIASELFISERTAAHHVAHIFDKLGVSSRVEAAGVAHQAGVLEAAHASGS